LTSQLYHKLGDFSSIYKGFTATLPKIFQAVVRYLAGVGAQCKKEKNVDGVGEVTHGMAQYRLT
jgi:hypothetical protein